MNSRTCVLLALAAVSSAAQADFFSFGSDSNPDGPTFLGGRNVPGRFRDAAPVDPSGSVTSNLLWDADEDGPLQSVLVPSVFRFQGDFTNYSRQNVFGVFIHSYTATGFAEYRTIGTNELALRIDFTNAVFTSVSSAETSWGATATLQDQSRTDTALTFTAGSALPGANYAGRTGDFAFTLSNLRATQGGAVSINTATGNPTIEWRSEGSFSAHVVPAPAALSVLGLAGLTAGRRRR
jgi:hypothetical protein